MPSRLTTALNLRPALPLECKIDLALSNARLKSATEVMSAGARDEVVASEVRTNFEHATLMIAMLIGPPIETALPAAQCCYAEIQGQLDLWLWSGDPDPTAYRDAASRSLAILVAQALRDRVG